MNRPHGQPRLATALLLAVTAAWGSSFYLTRDLLRDLPAADFLAVRFALAAAVMVAALHRHIARLDRRELAAGALLGAVYGAAQLVQTVGLAHTSATRSGFITGLYVVLTPAFAAVVLRVGVGRATWLASVLACAGLAVLCLGSVGWGFGESLTLVAAALYAVHILVLGAVSRPGNALGLAAVQIAVVAVVCLGPALPGGVATPGGPAAWAVVAYLALVCGAAAMWAQTWAQAHLAPARAAVVMTMEPVFAAGFAALLGGEDVTWRVALGGLLVMAGLYVAEFGGAGAGSSPAVDPDVPLEALHHDGA